MFTSAMTAMTAMTAVPLTVIPPAAASMTEPVTIYKPDTARERGGY